MISNLEFQETYLNNFRRGEYENQRFWSRFSERPDLRNATVLDVGSGWGSLCIEMAQAGAKKVVGLDLKSDLVDFSKQYLERSYPELIGRVEFKDIDLSYYDDQTIFDYIVSKDSFEHIIDLDGMLREMKKRLKPGGRIYAGFGPLYTSPYGDHDRRQVLLKPWGIRGQMLAYLPWAHLFLEPTLIKMNNLYREEKISSIYDLGLNGRSVSDYRKAFKASGLSIVDFRVNQAANLQSKVFSMLNKVPFLENYCTHNIYCILEKSGE